MSESMNIILLSSAGLIALGMCVMAALKAWQGWLDLRRLELSAGQSKAPRSEAMELIEMADLKERIRKLESIAACIDL